MDDALEHKFSKGEGNCECLTEAARIYKLATNHNRRDSAQFG